MRIRLSLIRQFFQKGSYFVSLTPERIEIVQDRLNNRPRKRLGFVSSMKFKEISNQQLVFMSIFNIYNNRQEIFSKIYAFSNDPRLMNMMLYLVSSLFVSIIGILINPFLALGLSPTDYAIIGYFASIAMLLGPIISFSFASYYSKNYFQLDDVARDRLLQVILTSLAGIGALVFLVFCLIYFLYHHYFVQTIPYAPYALLSFLPSYFLSFYNIYLLELRMRSQAKRFAIVTIINAIVTAVVSIVLVYFLPFGAIGRLCALLAVSVVVAFYAIWQLKIRFLFDKKILRESYGFCWPLVLSALLSYFFMGVDRLFLAQINDNHELGLYNVAIQITGYLGVFGTVIFQTFQPDIYKNTAQNNHLGVVRFSIIILLLCALPNLLFIPLARFVIDILTSGRYVDAISYSIILCLRNVTMCFAFLASEVLVAYGYSKYELYNRAIGAVIAVSMYYWVVAEYAFYGAAWVQVFSWLAMGGISIFVLYWNVVAKINNK